MNNEAYKLHLKFASINLVGHESIELSLFFKVNHSFLFHKTFKTRKVDHYSTIEKTIALLLRNIQSKT